ncbi:hypothetical protein EEDFHM_03924 [Methylorubrum populi]
MTAILFLDVDGVLNTHAGWRAGHDGLRSLDPGPVARLNGLCARTGCRVVVSSTWRGGPYRGPDGCRARLRALGVRVRFHRDWRTGRDRSRIRGREIAAWLAAHPEVTAYAIVDDDGDMLPDQMPRLVQTGYELGLEAAHAERLAALLATQRSLASPSCTAASTASPRPSVSRPCSLVSYRLAGSPRRSTRTVLRCVPTITRTTTST